MNDYFISGNVRHFRKLAIWTCQEDASFQSRTNSNGPGYPGPSRNYVVKGTLSNFSIGEMYRNVKLLGKIISVFSPQNAYCTPKISFAAVTVLQWIVTVSSIRLAYPPA